MNREDLKKVFKEAFREWRKDNTTLRAAALTFFIILPLPSLLLIVIAIFSLFYGEAQAIQLLIQQITAVVGPAVAELFRELLASAESPFTTVWESVFVVGFSIGGAIGAFAVLRDTIDLIWEVKLPPKQPLFENLRQKIGPFLLLSALGLIVIAWTAIASALLNAIITYSINQTLTLIALTAAQVFLSFSVAALLFAIIYKMFPQTQVHWRDVTLSSIITAIAFTTTNYIFGSYIQTFTITTIIGAAGSLMILLLWIFILNQIILFGAELSKAYAVTIGTHSKPRLPSVIEKVVRPIQSAGAKIEQASKVRIIGETETTKETQELPIPPPQVPIEPEPEIPPKQEMPEKPGIPPMDQPQGSLEVTIKIKTPDKDQEKRD